MTNETLITDPLQVVDEINRRFAARKKDGHMRNDKEWRPKVGERVRFEGVVESIDDDDLPYGIRGYGGGVHWFSEGILSPLPAAPEPRKPWEVLQDAAVLCDEDYPATAEDLRSIASSFEAAAVPTLAEAVRAYLRSMDTRGEAGGDLYASMKEALARAENGA